MNTAYIQLEIIVPDDLQEILIAEMSDLDFEGFDQFDDRMIAWIPENRLHDTTRETVEHILMRFGKGAYIKTESRQEPQNYNEIWEASIRPMRVGRFFVKPTWAKETDEDAILLEIDPKMAFGTGYHETTRIMLRMLPDFIERGSRVMDAGTGTGILAIAAAKLGAGHVFAFDIDEWSYTNSAENILINGVKDQVEIKLGDASVIPENSIYDVIIANINRNILISMAKTLVHHIKPGGTVILSGLLTADETVIKTTSGFDQLQFVKKVQENDWIGLVFKKSKNEPT